MRIFRYKRTPVVYTLYTDGTIIAQGIDYPDSLVDLPHVNPSLFFFIDNTPTEELL